MKAAVLALAALLWQVPETEPPVVQPDRLRYERAISVPADAQEACAVLDAAVFPHAAPSLRDLRILPARDGASGPAREIPYALTMSEPMTEETEAARILNLRSGDGRSVVFDLEMPPGPYTDVDLDLDPAVHDFLATATVIGTNGLGPHGERDKSVPMGTFALFDLTSQHLSRDTTLHLQESTYRYLNVVLSLTAAPGAAAGTTARFVPAMVRGAEVPPSREAQTLYTTVAETTAVTTVGRESRAEFSVPRRVPVERVRIVLAPDFKGNFDRAVRVTAIADAKPAADGDGDTDLRAPLPEVVSGNILRVHETVAGREVRAERLGVPAILGANLQRAAKVQVTIENGDDPPLPVTAVRLEMRQRKLCFGAAASIAGLALYYGDPLLPPPVYGYEPGSARAETAELGPERPNPEFQMQGAGERPTLQRHPKVIWIVLLAVILGAGLRSTRRGRSRPPGSTRV